MPQPGPLGAGHWPRLAHGAETEVTPALETLNPTVWKTLKIKIKLFFEKKKKPFFLKKNLFSCA
jgi:hypothetical protein